MINLQANKKISFPEVLLQKQSNKKRREIVAVLILSGSQNLQLRIITKIRTSVLKRLKPTFF